MYLANYGLQSNKSQDAVPNVTDYIIDVFETRYKCVWES